MPLKGGQRIGTDIKPEQYRRLKIKLAKEGKFLSDIMRELIEYYLTQK